MPSMPYLMNLQRSSTLLLLPLLAALLATGCGSAHPAHGGKLSEAMEKASEDNNGERNVEIRHDPVVEEPIEEEDSASFIAQTIADIIVIIAEPRTPSPSSGTRHGWLALTTGGGLIDLRETFGHYGIGLRLGLPVSDRSRISFTGDLALAAVSRTSRLARSTDDPLMVMSGGVQYGYDASQTPSSSGLYFLFGLHARAMRWSYRNAVTAGSLTVREDELYGFGFSAGIGTELVQTSAFRLGIEALPSATFWFPTTQNGFENDIFGSSFSMGFGAVFDFEL